MELEKYVENRPQVLSDSEKPSALYVHIPFCASKCAYCDFHSFERGEVDGDLFDAYQDSLLEQLFRWKDLFASDGFSTVYIGGGTPSLLPPRRLAQLLEGIARAAGSGVKEWTIEANPESANEEFFTVIQASPVTRLSLGIQSMDEEELSLLGRVGNVADNISAIERASKTGLELSADLMTVLPELPGKLRRKGSLLRASRFLAESGVGHLSIYDLVVEAGTRIEAALKKRELETSDLDRSCDERRETESMLASKGYARYEISNYAKAGRECLHNIAYWQMRSYLGIGSGAVSTLNLFRRSGSAGASDSFYSRKGSQYGALRVEGDRDLRAYVRSGASCVEEISLADSAFEMIMMGFRTAMGLDGREFERRFGFEAEMVLANTLKAWEARVRRKPDSGRIALDFRGMDLLNRFLVDCMRELEKLDWS